MSERRNERRFRALRAAKIAFHDRVASMDCMIRDLSRTGACLLVVDPMGIPNTFDLVLVRDQSRRPCRVVWRRATQIGVAFQPISDLGAPVNSPPRRANGSPPK